MATFLLATDGTHGDVLPFIRLGHALTRRGHKVVLYTHAVYAAASREAGLGFVPVDTDEDYRALQTDGAERWLNVLANADQIAGFYARHRLWEQLRREYEAMAAVVTSRPAGQVVVVGRHTTRFSPLLVREALGAPVAWVGVTPTQYMGAPLAGRLYARSLTEPMNRVRAAVGLPPLTDWDAWLSQGDLLLGLWPDWFDAAGAPAPPGAALTGFVLHDAAETGPLPPRVSALTDAAVPAARRPVLITGGSGKLLRPDWYEVAVQACAAAGRAGVVVCRHRDLLPATLPTGMWWEPSLPFGSLMPRVAAVLHHGGVLTSARGIASGVPQVVMAHGYDRSDNAARLRRLGVGEWVPAARWNPTEVAALLTRILDDPAYRERAAALTPAIDPAAAVAAACDRLEALIGPRANPTTPHQPSHPASEEAQTPGNRQTSLDDTDGRRPERGASEAGSRRLEGLSAERRALLGRWLRQPEASSPVHPTDSSS